MARAWAWVLLACAATCAAQTKKGQKDLGFAAPAPAQAWCQSGVSYGKACCDAECKVCGGNGCKGHAVGEERCCAANINAKKRMCTDVQDVVCVIPTSLIESTQVIENRCKEEVDYLKYTRNRLSRWSGNWTISWQQMINNKALGIVFARRFGVKTPKVLWCNARGLSALPDRWPAEWGRNFVVKPLNGHSLIGVTPVMISASGKGRNVFTRGRCNGREDVNASLRAWDHHDSSHWAERTWLVEEFMETAPRLANGAVALTMPVDYKFLVFGKGQVAAVLITQKLHSKDSCMFWVDATYKRIDTYGCVCEKCLDVGQSLCTDEDAEPRPAQWSALVQTASKLGAELGIHYRIDLYLDREGTPVLGEFTPWSYGGRFHCAVPAVRQLAGSIFEDMPDPCYLGKVWRYAGVAEGGSAERKPPPKLLEHWARLMRAPKAQCDLVTDVTAAENVREVTLAFVRSIMRFKKHDELKRQIANRQAASRGR